MVNNAGTGGTESAGMVHEMSEETWDFVMCAPRPIVPLPQTVDLGMNGKPSRATGTSRLTGHLSYD